MRRRSALAALAVCAAGLPIAAGARADVTCDIPQPSLAFDAPVFIDKNKAGGEPVSVIGQDGSINVSTHAGTTHAYKDSAAAATNATAGAGDFVVGYGNEVLNFRSTDGGKTWAYIGLGGTGAGPHSLTSTGFSDPDYAIDAGGRIYNTEINLANVAVFSSNDDGQSYNLAEPEVTSGDRPWLTAGKKDEVWLYVNTGQQIFYSTDAGKTWTLQTSGLTGGSSALPNAKFYVDPANPNGGLIGPHNKTAGITISKDSGKTWKAYDGANLGPTVDFFGAIAVDKTGNAYAAAAGGYSGPTDTTASGSVTYNYFDRSKGAWASVPITIPIPEGDAMWPWIVAGDDGRVAVAWLQNLKGKPNEFYWYVAMTTNGHGSTVTCSDGSTKSVKPQFAVANATGRPIHVGAVCLNGTTCNASPGDAGDRRLGDFITVNFDKNGQLFVTGGDTTLKSPTGGKKVVGNPLFVHASAGSTPMTATPMVTRPSRPLCLLPTCF